MGLRSSNSGLFSIPGFIISPVGKGERRGKKSRRDGGKQGIEKESKEEGIKMYCTKEKKKEF